MSIVIHDVQQGTPEWHKARAGIPTASRFYDIAKKLKSGAYSAERRKYLFTLLGERYTGEIAETYDGGALARGKAMEDEARKLYEFHTDNETKLVGFITSTAWRAGCSPDFLVGNDGGGEIKTKTPHLHFDCLETGEVPEEHVDQCQGAMGITGRAWWDFVSYWPKCPVFIKRIHRDESRIALLKIEVSTFANELDSLVAKYTQKAA
jgi:hypothetical protein